MTELARTLNVSRQAIYDWQAGASITAENAEKLANLARATDVLAAERLTTSNEILRRRMRRPGAFSIRFGMASRRRELRGFS